MKGLSEVIPKDNDGYCTIYKMDCADGLGLMTVYQVFPGIQLIYNDFEATEYEWESILDKDILEINHCREGREGSRLLSGSCLYLGEGDLSIHTMDNCASEMSFPLKHYRGISVVINLTTVSKNSPEILMEAGIDILAFRNKFCASGDCFIMRAKDEIEHIFSELYSIPDCLQNVIKRNDLIAGWLESCLSLMKISFRIQDEMTMKKIVPIKNCLVSSRNGLMKCQGRYVTDLTKEV